MKIKEFEDRFIRKCVIDVFITLPTFIYTAKVADVEIKFQKAL